MNNKRADATGFTILAGSAATGGTPAMLGGDEHLIVPVSSVASGAPVAVETQGVFAFPKVTGAIASTIHTAAESFAVGASVYWDETNAKATAKAVGPKLGFCVLAAATSDATVSVAMTAAATLPAPIVVTASLNQALNSATGTHVLPGGKVPSGYMPVAYAVKVDVTFTSASADAATIALGIETDDADALVEAVAISDASDPWDLGVHTDVPATGVVTTAERSIVATVGVTALTAGRATISVLCIKAGW